ncbi:MAG TPA: hypothetical protein VNH19_07475 [Candidatus Limnocylindrales bacterium]|nr:hypothetical protein [Candidatus Limnocylindrales bacterium]
MKKLFLAACFTFALAALGPVASAAGPGWPFHRHHKDKAPAAAKAEKPAKNKKSMFHRQKSQDKTREQSANAEVAAGVSPGPKSVGWRRQSPGPAGAGAR